MSSILKCVLACALTLASAGCTDQGPPKPNTGDSAQPGGDAAASSEPGGASPKECFRKLKAAYDAKDWSTYHDCLTRESRDAMLPALVFLGGARSLDDAEKTKAYRAILATHGIEALAEDQKQAGDTDPFKDVADRRALFVALMAFGMQAGAGEDAIDRVEEIVVKGDTATCVIVSVSSEGKDRRDSGRFRKVEGRWFADLGQEEGR